MPVNLKPVRTRAVPLLIKELYKRAHTHTHRLREHVLMATTTTYKQPETESYTSHAPKTHPAISDL